MGQSSTYDLNQTPAISEYVEFSLCDMTTGGVNQERIQQHEKTYESVPFISPSFDKTPIDLNVAYEFSLESHQSIGQPTFDKTPIDSNDPLDFSLESHQSICPPTFEKSPIDLNDALDISFQSHPSIGSPTFDKTLVDLDGGRNILVDHGEVKTMENEYDIKDPSLPKNSCA